MSQVVGVRAFLKREGFEFAARPDQIRARLRRLLPPDRQIAFDELESVQVERELSAKLYALPETLRQAHLIFSSDAARTVASFEWLADTAAGVEGRILDLGCGTGAFARFVGSRQPEANIVGLDGASNLIRIAREASAGLHQVRFVEATYDQIAVLEEKFDLITSACAMDMSVIVLDRGDDLTEDQCKAGEFVNPPALIEQFEIHFGGLLAALRKRATEHGRLAIVERLTTFTMFSAFAEVAARRGWRLDLEQSKQLRFAGDTMPALLMRATDPHALELDLEQGLQFWSKERSAELAAVNEGAIIAYLRGAPTVESTVKVSYRDGTMFTETGVFSNGRRYSYRFSTTGFRELKMAG